MARKPIPPALVEQPPSPELGIELDKIAIHFAQRLAGAEILPENINAFKALTAYYAMRHKIPADDDEKGKGAFGGHLDALTNSGDRGRGSAANGTASAF